MPRLLLKGMSGEDVRNLQVLLNYHLVDTLPPLVPSGDFGQATFDAVIAAQQLANKVVDPEVGPIVVDGKVGPVTRKVLVNLGMLTGNASMSFQGAPIHRAQTAALFQRPGYSQLSLYTPVTTAAPPPSQRVGINPFPSPFQPPNPTPPTPPTPGPPISPKFPTVSVQSVTIQLGNTFSWFPYAPSPFVVGAQSSFLFRLGFMPPFLISPQVQFSKNGVNSPNGDWTGQGAIQFSPPTPLQLGTFNLGSAGEIDLASPFVAAFVQRNAAGPGPSPPQAGGAAGNQFFWQFFDGKLQIVVTAQVVAGWALDTGKGLPVSLQFGTALQLDLFKILFGK